MPILPCEKLCVVHSGFSLLFGRQRATSEFFSIQFYTFHGLTQKSIISTLDVKSRSLLEKDPANPNVEQSSLKTPATSRKGLASSTSSAMGSRSALKEAIAAQKRARLTPGRSLPPRPESAQSTFSDAKTSDPPSKSSTTTRTIPTGAHVSSLSSAPMRPAMKPRRPELGRPATADPYARRSGTEESRSRATTPKADGSPRTLKVKPSATPSSKPASATRPRQKTDPAQTGTTTSKPKKLDISKSRLHDQQAASRSRSGSDDSPLHHASDGRGSPAPIQLESPPGSMTQRHTPAAEEPIPIPSDSITLPPPRFQSVGRNTPEPPQEPAVQVDDHMPSPDAIPNSVRKQSAPVQIYEDPVAPAPTELENHPEAVSRDEYFISADTLARDEEKAEREDINPIAMDDAPAVATEEPEASSHECDEVVENDIVPAASNESANIDTLAHDAPAVAAEPEAVSPGPVQPQEVDTGLPVPESTDVENQPGIERPVSPASSVVHHPVADVHAPSSGQMSPGSSRGNNENSTPLVSKVVNVSPENRSASRQNVLEEIPNNEPAQRDNRPPQHLFGKRRSSETAPVVTHDPSHRRWKKLETADRQRSLSPRSKDPATAREMLEKGIQRIRTKTMDILGYRKLQGLIEYHEDIFADEGKYDAMLEALLNELESPPDERRQPIGRPLDVKTQVLVTIRFMFRNNQDYFAAYYPKAMTALVSARKRYASSSHIVSGLEETAEEIIAACPGADVIEAVLKQMERENKDEEGYRAITMGTSIVSRLVRRLNAQQTVLETGMVERIGQFSGRHLTDRQPEVRRQVTELSVALYKGMKDEGRFWQVMGSPRENSRNLLTYYIHK